MPLDGVGVTAGQRIQVEWLNRMSGGWASVARSGSERMDASSTRIQRTIARQRLEVF